MRDFTYFSANTVALFENNYDNMLQFNEVMMDTSNGIHVKYTKEEANTIIRNQFDRVLGINFKTASVKERRQALRRNKIEIAQLIEDVLVDKMVSGWNVANARFMAYVDTKNIGLGDENEFYVADNSLLQVSKFAGNHYDVVRQALREGASFRVEMSKYVIKTYADYELFMLGRIDFAEFTDRMYKSIEQNRYAGLFTAFMTMDSSLPTDLILGTAVSEATKDAIIDHIEAIKAATGKDVMLVGTRTAIQKLQNVVNYALFTEAMKEERNKNGILGNWEGYECLALNRVNKVGTTESVFSADDNKKIFILPVDADFKPIKLVQSGDVEYIEAGMDGASNMDATASIDIRYEEGIGVVINQLFGEIRITG